MKRCCLPLVLALYLSPGAAQPPPVAAFAALPAMQSPAISPDGKRLAFITHTDAGGFVYAVQLATNQADAIVAVTDSNERAVTWANDDTLILLVSGTETLHFAARMVEQLTPLVAC